MPIINGAHKINERNTKNKKLNERNSSHLILITGKHTHPLYIYIDIYIYSRLHAHAGMCVLIPLYILFMSYS